MLRDAAIALSLANLCFTKVWGKLLSNAGSYFNESRIVYASIILDVLLLAAIFWTAMTLVRRYGGARSLRLARWSFLVMLFVSLNGVIALLTTFIPPKLSLLMGRSVPTIFAVVFTLLTVFAFVRWRRHILNTAPGIVLALFTFAILTFSQAIWSLIQPATTTAFAAEKAPVRPTTKEAAASRVLWIVFDELDQRMLFAERPSSVRLPELDHLRAESVYATNAYPPAPLTYMSMPALITGKLISKVTPAGPGELMIHFDESKDPVRWSTQPNVFSAARQSGLTTGLVGWSHPYCEIIGNELSSCEVVKEWGDDEISLAGSMFSQCLGLLDTVPLTRQIVTPLVQSVAWINEIALKQERLRYQARYHFILNSTLKAATNRELDLVMVHMPVPHPPGIYDRNKGDFSLKGESSYLDNLALVDRTVGDLRRAMERAGTWDDTTILITADHWWRADMWARGPFSTTEDLTASGGKTDHRIPFLLKLRGQKESVTYDPDFNTLLTHDLLLALLRGEVSNASTVAAWLDRHRSFGDSPYNRDELLP